MTFYVATNGDDRSTFDFTLADDSPALVLGFVPIDVSRAGVR